MIEIPHALLPVLVTIGLLGVMLRPYHSIGDYDMGAIFRLFWLIPIAFVWVVYLGVLLAITKWYQ